MDSLQFEKAEFHDPRPACTACRTPIDRDYFHFGGRIVCAACAEKVRNAQQRPSTGAVMRGFWHGAGMAIVCAIGYAILTLTLDAQIAFMAIAVGYLIGRAVRIGSRGLGGRRCQILAVILTYFAITISYTPLLIKQMKEQAKVEAAKKAPSNRESPAPAKRPVSPIGMAAAYSFIALMALLAPFLELANGLNGIIGIVIILVGLVQAWRQTARDSRILMGPYPIEGTSVGHPAEGMSSVG